MICWRIYLAALCVAVLCDGLVVAAGSDRDRIVLPVLPKIVLNPSRVSGLGGIVEIEIAQQEMAGYVPTQINLLFPGPLTADRTLTFRFETNRESPPVNGLKVDVPVVMPQGTRQRAVVRYLPSWSSGNSMSVSIRENGRELVGSMTQISNPQGLHGPQECLSDEIAVHWLYVSDKDRLNEDDVPDLRGAIIVPPAVGSNANLRQSRKLANLSGTQWESIAATQQAHAVGVLELPQDWRAYQRYDVVILGAMALDRLSENPAANQALRVWIRMGGSLIVCGDVGSAALIDHFHLDGLEIPRWSNQLRTYAMEAEAEWSEFHATLAEQVAELADALNRQQANPNGPMFNALFRLGIYVNDVEHAQEVLQTRRDILQRINQPSLSPRQWDELLWVRSGGGGRVYGLQLESGESIPTAEHFHMIRKLLGYRRSPTLRRGVDPIIGDGRFRQWTIAGVAEPPVYTFMGLLSVFVVLVGPIAYRQTAKHGRSYLMFAIAPTLAVMTTLAMFAYGIVADGFQTTARIRQLTWVDGRSGDAVERVRATYFAGLRPRQGMTFPADAEVMRYPEDTNWSWEDLTELREASIGGVTVGQDRQTFDASMLPARQQRQFVSHVPRDNVGSLSLIRDPADLKSVRVVSSLNLGLGEVVLCDAAGDYWYLESLDTQETRQAKRLAGKEISTVLGLMYRNHRPLARTADRQKRARARDETYDISTAILRRIGNGPNNLEGVFESWIRSNLQTSGAIPRNHFIATAAVSADVIAYDETEVVESIRYVFGTLR